MTINHAQMVQKLAKDGKDILSTLDDIKVHVWHMASCLMGEAGELLEGQSNDDIVEELGDLEFYMAGLRGGLGIGRLDILQLANGMLPAEVSHPCYDAGILIESCNIFDACKKWIIYEKVLDTTTLYKAMARFEWYMSCYRGATGISYDQTIAANMTKLAKRYGADYSYTNEKAQIRADKA